MFSAVVRSSNKPGAIMAVLCAVAFMAQLDLFIVNVALPSMGRSFHGAGLGSLSWVLNGYAIVFAAALVPAGRLADHLGRRRFLLWGVAVFTLASAICAASPNLAVLVGARVLQSVGAAMIVPTSLGLLLPAFPASRHSFVVGVWAGVAAVAGSSGPPIGGLLLQESWRWVFIINVPIGIATLLAGRAVLPEVRAEPGTRVPDLVSATTALAAITLITLATVEGSIWGWLSARLIALVAVALLALAVTVRRCFAHPSPLIEPQLFRSREFSVAAVALVLFFMAFAAFLLSVVLFLENVWHYSTLRTGLAIAPGPMMAALVAVNAGRITTRFGRAAPAIAGPLLFAAMSAYWLWRIGPHSHYLADYLPGGLLGGAGAGLTQAPLFAATGALPHDRAGTGSAVLSMARQFGSALGVAILVAIYASPSPHNLSAFHDGWVFQGAAALLATAASVVGVMLARHAYRRAPVSTVDVTRHT